MTKVTRMDQGAGELFDIRQLQQAVAEGTADDFLTNHPFWQGLKDRGQGGQQPLQRPAEIRAPQGMPEQQGPSPVQPQRVIAQSPATPAAGPEQGQRPSMTGEESAQYVHDQRYGGMDPKEAMRADAIRMSFGMKGDKAFPGYQPAARNELQNQIAQLQNEIDRLKNPEQQQPQPTGQPRGMM